MSNNKQSSVEWQHVELIRIDYQYAINKITPREYQEQTKHTLEQAKAMHKKEIISAVNFGQNNHTVMVSQDLIIAEKYYNETYGGKNEQQ